MTRENTFTAEGDSAIGDIRAMLDGYSPPDDLQRVEVTFVVGDPQPEPEPDTVTASATADPEPEVADDPLPDMKSGTRRHEILELLVNTDDFLTNDEIAAALGFDNRSQAQTTTSSLHRDHGLLTARRSEQEGSRFKYAATRRGEKMLERLGPFDG